MHQHTRLTGKPNTLHIGLSESRMTNLYIAPFFFIGGTVTFTLGPWCFLLSRIPDKNDCCTFTRGSRGEVMIFFEKNKVLGVEPNRVLNILEGI